MSELGQSQARVGNWKPLEMKLNYIFISILQCYNVMCRLLETKTKFKLSAEMLDK